MVRPSNPRLMARVLDAVANLSDTKGSSAHEVLSFIRHSNVSSKNLTLQVHRALKHAVNAGLLRQRSGRYKALATLNPNSVSNPAKEPPANKEPTNNQINKQKKSKSDVETPISDVESSETQERKLSPCSHLLLMPKFRESCRLLHQGEELIHAKKSLHREPKRKEMRAKSKDKSASRARNPQLLQRAVQSRQHSTEETENDRQQCDENHEFTEHNTTRQEVHKDIERVHESNNSNSGSTLENSRD
ncbi:hypothetical protein ALC57_04864 [Trachymyrmex cornetzi]|uniref:H15 domain-containing protein n=1 Tax=Trachymyrmex cornetzi TaxID=471704 RepID=A0A195ECY5_9HYME|nr:hypothetical protein ALC57_04864 [Trachymyrmex cornetzi]